MDSIPNAAVVINLDIKRTDVGDWVIYPGVKVEPPNNYFHSDDADIHQCKYKCVYGNCLRFAVSTALFNSKCPSVSGNEDPHSEGAIYAFKRGKDHYLGKSHRSSVLYLSLFTIKVEKNIITYRKLNSLTNN